MARFTIPKIQNVLKATTARIFGRVSAGTGRAEELTAAQVRTLLSVQTTAEAAAAYQPIGNYATLVGGLVPSSQLPSYVDDVIEGANLAAFPATGETGKIYVALDTGKTYRWGGSAYVELTDSTAIWGSISGTLSNQTDLQNALNAKASSSHTHTTADITGFGEAVDDEVASLLVAGTNITITYNDAANTLTIASTASGGTPGGSSGQVQFNNAGAFGGAAAVVYAATGTHFVVTAQSATAIPVCVKAAASQTGNLTEWQTSAGTITLRVTSAFEINNPVGDLLLSGAASGTSATVIQQNGFSYFRLQPGTGILVSSSRIVGWTSNAFNINTSADTALARNAAGVVEVNNGTAGTLRDLHIRNVGLNGAISAGGGVGIAFIANATTVPTSNPTGGGILYAEAGALKYRGSSGTVTTLGPA